MGLVQEPAHLWSSQVSTQATKRMTHWQAAKLTILCVSSQAGGRGHCPEEAHSQARGSQARSQRQRKWNQSLGAFIPEQIITKPSLGYSPAPSPHPNVQRLAAGLFLLHLTPPVPQPPPGSPPVFPPGLWKSRGKSTSLRSSNKVPGVE